MVEIRLGYIMTQFCIHAGPALLLCQANGRQWRVDCLPPLQVPKGFSYILGNEGAAPVPHRIQPEIRFGIDYRVFLIFCCSRRWCGADH